jgi:hypothetical protein
MMICIEGLTGDRIEEYRSYCSQRVLCSAPTCVTRDVKSDLLQRYPLPLPKPVEEPRRIARTALEETSLRSKPERRRWHLYDSRRGGEATEQSHYGVGSERERHDLPLAPSLP